MPGRQGGLEWLGPGDITKCGGGVCVVCNVV